MDRDHDYHDLHPVRLSVGGSNLGRVRNKQISLKRVQEMLFTPSVDASCTYAGYLALPKEEQDKKKAAPGFFLGGPCKDGKRALRAMSKRHLITLDIDQATTGQIDYLKSGQSAIQQHRYFGSTTRKHCTEKPRWRLIFPLRRPVTAEEFTAISRVLASRTFQDPEASMIAVDDVSVRMAQPMFRPSISKGQDFDTIDNPGALLDPDAFLAKLDFDWRDLSQLPYSEERGAKRPTLPGAKAEDPTEKRGIIGAFCRAYDVEAAIEEYLPDVYVPGDTQSGKPRYSYTAGTTTNGAIVEDDGLFLYSHHGSDPCADRLVNSWDLVRLHKFGHMDEEAHGNTTPTNWPSHKAMAELAEADDAVRAELASTAVSADAFEDVEDDDTAAGGDDDLLGPDPATAPIHPLKQGRKALAKGWEKRLTLDKQGQIKKTKGNANLIVSGDKRIGPAIAISDLSGSPVLLRPLGFKNADIIQAGVDDPITGRPWVDNDTAALTVALSSARSVGGYELDFPERDLQIAMLQAAERHRFNPILKLLEMHPWDGIPRLETIYIDYFDVEDNPYHREVPYWWFIAGIARQYQPGIRFDQVPILGGEGGIGKSGFIQDCGIGFHGELSKLFHNPPKMVESTKGKLVLEVPELAGFKKADVEDLKAFFSGTQDTVRLAYRANEHDFLRRCIFHGTTNQGVYLRDETGNRRYWPIKSPRPKNNPYDFKHFLKARWQVWAEAHYQYLRLCRETTGPLRLALQSGEANEIAAALQEDARETSIYEVVAEVIEEWLDKPVPRSAAESGANLFNDYDEDEPMVKRGAVNATLIREELASHPIIRDIRMSADKVIGGALNRLEGWTCLGKVRRNGQQRRWHVRENNSEGLLWIPV